MDTVAVIAGLVVLWFIATRLGIVIQAFREALGPTAPTHGKQTGAFAVEVVGESRYQDNLARICGPASRDGVKRLCSAMLIPEPTNRYDPNAVRVDIDGLPVGYLCRADAQLWSRKRGRQQFECPALIRGGWDRGAGDRGDFGVRLDLVI